jgi:adenylate cyclase
MGSVAQFNYTAIGDQVNLASRLEGVNKEFGTNIIASESTFEKARDRVEARELALIGVKGRKKPVRIFEILGRKGEVPAEKVAKARAFEKALEMLRKREWAKAREAFAAVGDTASKVYIEVCHEYEQNPPDEDWDGSYVMTHK